MPRLRVSEQQAKTDMFCATVAKQMSLKHIGKDQLSRLLGMSRSTFWEKMKTPTLFRLGELRQLFSVLDFTDEEKRIVL